MKADTFYFSHDYHARTDPKCSALIKEHGMSGYGLYWSLIEMIHSQGGKITKFPGLFKGLSHSLNIPEDDLMKQIEAMLNGCELLLQDENYIWSERALRNLQEKEEKKRLRSESGRKGGIISGASRKSTKQNEALLHNVERNEAKERKGKERYISYKGMERGEA